MRISDWSSDVCSSDLGRTLPAETRAYVALLAPQLDATSPSSAPSIAPPPPPDWREAPLFVVRSTAPGSVVSPPGNTHPDDSRASVAAASPHSIDTHNSPLVVARSAHLTPQCSPPSFYALSLSPPSPLHTN